MKKMLIAAVVGFHATIVQADTVGLYLGSKIWQNEASGSFSDKNTLNDFNIENKQQVNFFLAIENPYPFLPNLQITNAKYKNTGKSNSTETTSFVNNSITHTSVIDTIIDENINVSYIDYTLYFQVFNNDLFSLDLGLTARDFDGAITISETITKVNSWQDIYGTPYTSTEINNSERKIITDKVEPILYIHTNVYSPLNDLNVFIQGSFSLTSKHTLSDYQIGLDYDLMHNKAVDLNLNLGYQVVKMEFEDFDNLYSSLEFSGAFVGFIARF